MSEQDILISLDWLQVMLSGMQEIIKINLSSKAFFEITGSESKCKIKLFLFSVPFHDFSQFSLYRGTSKIAFFFCLQKGDMLLIFSKEVEYFLNKQIPAYWVSQGFSH